MTDVIKEGLGQYFSGRPDLKIIAEPGIYICSCFVCCEKCHVAVMRNGLPSMMS